jgi:DNA-binding winged helix-turn-helix (wHTH) protein/WD40 repeat protein
MGKVVRFQRPELNGRVPAVVTRPATPYNGVSMPVQVATTPQSGEPFLVGEWRVEPTLNRLVRGDVTVQLEHKAMDVLLCLAEDAGEVVTKHEILDAVWQTEFVSDNTLQRRIAELRDGFDDDALNPRYIETIRKRGYRLIAEVAAVDQQADAAPLIPEEPPTTEADRNPYPGLAAFNEADFELFFGREGETAALWRTIASRRLLAVIGPSGIGKSSLLRAGVAARAPPGWRAVVFAPGESPVLSLARALAPDHAGDPAAVSKLVGFADPDIAMAVVSRWRGRFEGAVLIVDQFEELFTLNTSEVQANFIGLLRRLVDAADVHVVLAMRDDFLYRCHGFPEIAPIFKNLTPLAPPAPESLRRALTEPAARRLHRFESEVLVDRMVAEVEDQRSALPLLAFAVHRLWEERDRDDHLLTEEAYDRIGGVGGALARHAEAVVAEIGHERLQVVREIFRNLVTAEGTRAVREIDELLSVFERSALPSVASEGLGVRRRTSHGERSERSLLTPDNERSPSHLLPTRAAAREVLDKLIDARLLTSFETHDIEDTSTRRVEISHESLLANWPRLVRWQTQDADAVQLRDQLRQAAKTWDEHDRTDDLLWTGSAYREFAVWRESYPGGLTGTEEAFATAMTGFSTRRRRRRRMAATAILILATVVAVVFIGLWRRGVLETRRAEASKLVALAQAQLETDPTEALAYATASVELADSPTARSFLLRALWEAPPARVLESPGPAIRFSPEGGWVAVSGFAGVATVWSDSGDGPINLPGLETSPESMNNVRWISENLLATGMNPVDPVLAAERVRIWSIPDGDVVQTIEFGAGSYWQVEGHRLFAATLPSEPAHEGDIRLRSWRLPDGEPKDLGIVDWNAMGDLSSRVDPSGSTWIYPQDRTIFARPLPAVDGGRHKVVGAHATDAVRPIGVLRGDQLASIDGAGELRLWSLSEPGGGPLRVIPRPEGAPAPTYLYLDPTGRWVGQRYPDQTGKGLLWDLSALPGAQPLELRRSGSWQFSDSDYHPTGNWFAASTKGSSEVSFWSLSKAYPSVVTGATSRRKGLAFSPDGRWLAATWPGWRIKLFPLPYTDHTRAPKLGEHPAFSNLSFDASGTRVTGGHWGESLSVGFLDGREPRKLEGFLGETLIESLAFSPSGRLVAAASGISYDEKMLRVWDLDSGETRVFELPRTDTSECAEFTGYLDNVQSLWFTDEETVYTVGATAFLRWNLRYGSSEEVVALGAVTYREAAASADGRKVLIIETPKVGKADICDTPELFDLATGTAEELPSFGDCVRVIALDPGGEFAVTGDNDGAIRVGRITGGEPHLLMGHQGAIEYVAVSPDLRWVASVGADSTLRLWPMPDLTKPPLHTLPREELIAKLKTLTNLRVVRDPESSTGWKVEIGPFPGWETVPTW